MRDNFGDIYWFCGLTGLTKDTARRMLRDRLVPGAHQMQPGIQGSRWIINKIRARTSFDAIQRGAATC